MNPPNQIHVGISTPRTRLMAGLEALHNLGIQIYPEFVDNPELSRLFRVVARALHSEAMRKAKEDDIDTDPKELVEGRFCAYGHIDTRAPGYLIVTRELPHPSVMAWWGVNGALRFSEVPPWLD